MKAGVVTFPGSNCDRDVSVALENTGFEVEKIWHKDTSLPKLDLVVLPGGFSYGDALRCGAISAHSNIVSEVKKFAESGGYVLGICNGFQILTETKILPGALIRNRDIKFICKDIYLKPENTNTSFTSKFAGIASPAKISIAHHDGNFFIENEGLKALNDNEQIAFKYCDEKGNTDLNANPNGSVENIAGVFNKNKNVLGLMPHPERHCDPLTGGVDGKLLFESLLG